MMPGEDTLKEVKEATSTGYLRLLIDTQICIRWKRCCLWIDTRPSIRWKLPCASDASSHVHPLKLSLLFAVDFGSRRNADANGFYGGCEQAGGYSVSMLCGPRRNGVIHSRLMV